MNKSVLISIQPKWVEKIANGSKTIEVRKNRPKIETPFKCYIYCTIGNGVKGDYLVPSGIQCGKVIGSFTCDSIEMVNASCSDYGIDLFYHDCITKGCLTEREVENYFNIPEDKDLRAMKGNGYAWHISDLKIYNKPKELSEFWTIKCTNKRNGCQDCKVKPNCIKTITRPPQSYMFVEEIKYERDFI